ncbi:lamin tail domain-containing protein [Streptomyces sp. NPDC020801]|uniref:lamin tail domain-containing protein n=1 Tax=unclassified Streptomyces TaxID=2593676 RepID=UPI0037B5A94D
MTTRRLAAAALAAGALVGSVALPASAADHDRRFHPRVEISNVRYDSPGRENRRQDRSVRVLNQQWVALTNSSWRDVNLNGWTLSDRDGHTYTFHHYRLDGRATVRVHTGYGRDTRTDLFQDRRDVIWNRHDTATLRDEHGRLVDTVTWGGERRDYRDDDRRDDRRDVPGDDRRDDRRDDRHGDRH